MNENDAEINSIFILSLSKEEEEEEEKRRGINKSSFFWRFLSRLKIIYINLAKYIH